MTEQNYEAIAAITAYAKTLKDLGYTEKQATLIREVITPLCTLDELPEIMSNIISLESAYGKVPEE